MSVVTIILSDRADGKVGAIFRCDPPLRPQGPDTVRTAAELMGNKFVNYYRALQERHITPETPAEALAWGEMVRAISAAQRNLDGGVRA